MQLSNAVRQRIVNLLVSNNLSIKELSRISNVSYASLVSFMENRTKVLRLTNLYLICMGLKMDLVDFFDDDLFNDALDEREKTKVKYNSEKSNE